MSEYKVFHIPSPYNYTAIQRLSDMALIPTDPNNIDYQKYLEWVAEGNTPLPAEE